MILALALVLATLQEDPTPWIARLGHDLLEEREEASRRLQSMGPQVLERLVKAREEAGDPEIRARLAAIVENIRKAEELAKAFGPTRRVTLAARGWTLKDVMAELRKTGIATVDADDVDEEQRVDLQLRNATWWEAIDRTARVAGARCELTRNLDGAAAVRFVRGREAEGPVLYVEQFRISVAETKRVQRRAPGVRGEAGFVVVEIRRQPDLRPTGRLKEEGVRILAVRDAKSGDARLEKPAWAETAESFPRFLGFQAGCWVKPDAAGPLTVEGTTDLSFAKVTRELTLKLDENEEWTRVGDARIRVRHFSATKSGVDVTLEAEGDDLPELGECLVEDPIVMIDAAGGRHEGFIQRRREQENACAWSLDFPPDIVAPRRVVIRWVAELHRVRIPFRLEGVELPE